MNIKDIFIESNLPEPLSNEKRDYYLEKMKNGDINARNILIIHNCRKVLDFVIEKYSDSNYDLKELVSIGVMGLVKSVDTFDETKKITFSTYTKNCINIAILNFLRGEKKHNSNISLNIPVTTDDEGNEKVIEDDLWDEDIIITMDYEEAELINYIYEYINDLSERNKKIFVMYFGLEGNPRMSKSAIARELGIGSAAVSRILRRTIGHIKCELEIIGMVEAPLTRKKTKY